MIRVACTALMKRITAGHPNKDGKSFRGGGEDVTSDVLKAVIEYVEPGHVVTVNVNGMPAYEIEVRALSREQSQGSE